ncbi:hypothetical protein K438DRAFT_1714110 [Mycena galopus ATCC 62051]|nr:hypothetical protein K438DRAFT_1714110 [Mycena galopus ATCC 62051]
MNLKTHVSVPIPPQKPTKRFPIGRLLVLALLALLLASNIAVFGFVYQPQRFTEVPLHSESTLARCRALNTRPAPSPSFNLRTKSDRFQAGTRAVLVKNATIWTGRVDGFEVLKGDIFMDGGIIVALGAVKQSILDAHQEYDILDAYGAWVTPGIIDMHSHLAVEPSPLLQGASDGNSLKGLVLPYLRALDSMNTHDDGFALAVAGGITTSLILPGSADAMGGQGFVIKLRPTSERSSSALLLEPPFGINGSEVDYNVPPRWRHMKHACGENPAGVYQGTRMDTVWSVRKAYDEARKLKNTQDQYCAKALAGQWAGLGDFPSELTLEALVDILRGKFKVQTHCYEAVDIDAFIRLSNEFQFSVASFHHAHESYLVPEVLKQGYEHPPASAIFASFSRYKREAYRHSEFAARILADNGLKVVMKSDHDAIVSRYLMHEAQVAHYHGLSSNLALASVTSTPAEVLGLDHRIGFVKPGYDADIVVWDSHPLAIGATPSQVFIDGIAQFANPHVSKKPASQQRAPKTPDFDKEIKDTIKYEGLPPLEPATRTSGAVLFRNVSSFWTRDDESGEVRSVAQTPENVLVEDGVVVWSGSDYAGLSAAEGAVVVDLDGGSISPALVSGGAGLGLQEIAAELSTADGAVFDPLSMEIPTILGEQTVIRAVDGLQFGTRDALLAYRSGVASAITAPNGNGMFQGLSVSFSLGSRHKLEKGAILQDIAAIHVAISMNFAISVSTQMATLRGLLLDGAPKNDEHEFAFQQASKGSIPLVVTAHSADVIANLLLLKQEVEARYGKTIKMTIVGGAEAHLLAPQIAAAGVGVILTPPRGFPYFWEQRRILAGPPLTPQSSAALLASHGVVVGLGPQGLMGMPSMSNWAVRNLRFDMAWVALESGDSISKAAALAMASSNIEKLLGVRSGSNREFAVTRGGDLFSLESKVIAIVSSKRGVVDLF